MQLVTKKVEMEMNTVVLKTVLYNYANNIELGQLVGGQISNPNIVYPE